MTQIAFSPPPGLNSDEGQTNAQRKWYDGSNVRFREGKPKVIGGWAKMFATPLTGVPRKLFAFNRSGAATMAYGTASKLYVGSGAAQPSDRTPGGLGSSITAWSLAAWGSTLLAVPKGGTLYEQTGTSTAAAVSEAPDAINCMLVSSDRRQVIAFGCNEEVSGTFNGLCVRWSNFEDYSSAGSWTTSSANNAGEFILPGIGQIIAARHVGPVIWIWTDNSLWEMSFYGDPGQTYQFRLLDDNSGIAGPEAVEVLGMRAFWVRPDQRLVTCAPGELPKPITGPVSINLTAAFDNEKIVVSSNSRFGEIWAFYGTAIGAENSSYVAFNIETGTWFRGSLGRTAVLDDGALNEVLGGSYVSNIIMSDSSGYVYVHEHGTSADGGDLNWYLWSGPMNEDSYPRRNMLRRYLHGGALGAHTLEVYAADTPDGLRSVDALTLTILNDGSGKKDFRKSGKCFAVRLTGKVGSAVIPPLVFDVVPMGER